MTLTIGNSLCQIEGLTLEQYKSLRKELSYKIPGSYYSMDPNGGIRYLISKRGEFATGLLGRVEKWIKASRLALPRTDHRKRPTLAVSAIKARWDLVPYLVQTEAAHACVTRHRGVVQAPTGCGKSVMIALTIDRVKVKTLVVVPSLELKRQLSQSLGAIFGRQGMRYITVENVQALDPRVPANYDCVIIDEYHHSAAKSYRDLNKYAWQGVYYRFGFTATPFRGQEEEQVLMESIIADVIYSVPYKTAVDRGHIVPLEAYYIDVPKTEDVKGYTWAAVYKELVVTNTYRNRIIATLIQELRYAGRSTLCLVKEVAHGQIISAYQDRAGTPFAHGENPDTDKLIKTFSKGSGCLVATTGVCGEGVDTKACEYVILAGLGKSRPALMQAFGRCFRTYAGKESGKVIIFNDKSHKWTRAHFREQCRILKEEYGVTPLKITLDQS